MDAYDMSLAAISRSSGYGNPLGHGPYAVDDTEVCGDCERELRTTREREVGFCRNCIERQEEAEREAEEATTGDHWDGQG